MKTYALVVSGVVYEIIQPITYDTEALDWSEGDPSRVGNEIPIDERYTPEFVRQTYDITGLTPEPLCGWTYDGSVFSAPVVYQPSPAEILAANTAVRDYFLAQAALAISPLQDAVDLDDATPEEVALLKKWKQYRVAVNRIDLTIENPVWPTVPTNS